MAKTKLDIQGEGRVAQRQGQGILSCPYKAGSWQACAWEEGHMTETHVADEQKWAAERDARNAAEAGIGQSVKDVHPDDRLLEDLAEGRAAGVTVHDQLDNLPRDVATGIAIPFPVSMPSATREHIRCLEASLNFAAGNVDGSKLVRYARKIEVLYARHR